MHVAVKRAMNVLTWHQWTSVSLGQGVANRLQAISCRALVARTGVETNEATFGPGTVFKHVLFSAGLDCRLVPEFWFSAICFNQATGKVFGFLGNRLRKVPCGENCDDL